MLRNYIPDACAFEPEQISVLSKAFEETCNALRIFAGDQRGREIVAARIIDLARRGVMDPLVLRDRVLFEARVAA